MKRVVLLVVSALALAACGDDAPTSQISTANVDSNAAGSNSATGDVINVKMVDMAYEPTKLTVATGETVTFRFTNDSNVKHEAAIGTLEQQDDHHAEMAAAAAATHAADTSMTGHDMSAVSGTAEMSGHDMSGMAGHDMSGMNGVHGVTVEPGQTVELTHTFDTPGEILVGCHVPGHWEAGMKMTITVA